MVYNYHICAVDVVDVDAKMTKPQLMNRPKLIVAWWRHMAAVILVNIGSGNGLLPDGTKPLPDPILTYHQRVQWPSTEGNFTGDASAINH